MWLFQHIPAILHAEPCIEDPIDPVTLLVMSGVNLTTSKQIVGIITIDS